jgi:hypothetical protein
VLLSLVFMGFFLSLTHLYLGYFSLGLHPVWLISLQEVGFPSAGLYSLYCEIRVFVGSVTL